MKNRFWLFFLVSLFMVSLTWAAPLGQGQENKPANPLEKEIFHSLLMLPHYGVFDSLFFQLDNNNVTLLGQVLLPISKDEAGKRVAKIAGIGTITNNIEVLPVSTNDDHIRMRVYRKLFNTAGLYRYAMGMMPSIHIIVKRGHVVLEGFVSTEADSKLAFLAVKELTGVFSVKNNLKVEK